ncbi:MAG: DUF3098 domain-containing protein [Prevotellaceae bacterium]|nr:DUF3098 domain-containing protein [Prevotellaceae bacterium]
MTSKEKTKGFVLGKTNFALMAISLLIIILGFVLMLGEPSGETFNPDIFSTRRITVGPMISLFGFAAMVFAIMWKPKEK